MYNVLISFTDDVDGGVYFVGEDIYPKRGVEPTEERIAYLMGNGNKFGQPVIEPVEVDEELDEDDVNLDKMTVEQLKSFAELNGIEIGEAKLKADIYNAVIAAGNTSKED